MLFDSPNEKRSRCRYLCSVQHTLVVIYNQPFLMQPISCRISQDCYYPYTHASTTQIVYLLHTASGLSCDWGGVDTSGSIHHSQCCVEEQGASNQTPLWQHGTLAFDARGRTMWWIWEWNQEHCSSSKNSFSQCIRCVDPWTSWFWGANPTYGLVSNYGYVKI